MATPEKDTKPKKLNSTFLYLYITAGILSASYALFNFMPHIIGTKLLSWEGVFKFILVVVSGLNPILFFGLFISYKIIEPLFELCDNCN